MKKVPKRCPKCAYLCMDALNKRFMWVEHPIRNPVYTFLSIQSLFSINCMNSVYIDEIIILFIIVMH